MSETNGSSEGGRVALVGAGPGDPELITLKGLRRLSEASRVFYDRLAPDELLEWAPDAKTIDVGKKPGEQKRQQSLNERIIRLARRGHRVVRLKGGDPCVFGRGGEEALALARAGIPFEIVPGVTSAVGVPSFARIPLTHRDHAGSVAILTGHRQSEPSKRMQWKRLARGADTIVLLMSVRNLKPNFRRLRRAGVDPNTPAAAISRGTTPNQQVLHGTLETLPSIAADRDLRPPATIVVGEVVEVGREILRPLSEMSEKIHRNS